MSFQGYLNTIQAKTGKSADDFRGLADRKGLSENGRLKPGVKAGAVLEWIKAEYPLGHGHAMAIYALLSGKKSPGDS
ncbi:DUF4287 domain-containing protein [Rhizobiaceae bacterium n13]|uniref:DUF4287 domain-containing protein n=1 Tax=Ferirhizobium litorale TaxID=2927786 RepID=A0AAE3QJL7_9HYPH|nr:DUF4287 domain-containing protein [Fererhizobium litorale]MDI7864923.1 DUF4287 domain-containing protein [Fererhizobium litorale]MDI7925043.1 DUF4287 domain-containing protein [Fererhizobium litorale]